MKINKSNILVIIGFILVITSIIFLIYNNIEKQKTREEVLELENKIKESKELPGDYLEEEVSEEEIDPPSDAIGVIRVDKIDIVLPIYGDSDRESLANGVGVVETTENPTSEDNTISVLAGHRGGRNEEQSFLNIDKLDPGDEVIITTEKETLYYKVYNEEVIEPTDWSKFVREEDKSKLFLMSCHPYPKNDKRLLIKTELYKAIEN